MHRLRPNRLRRLAGALDTPGSSSSTVLPAHLRNRSRSLQSDGFCGLGLGPAAPARTLPLSHTSSFHTSPQPLFPSPPIPRTRTKNTSPRFPTGSRPPSIPRPLPHAPASTLEQRLIELLEAADSVEAKLKAKDDADGRLRQVVEIAEVAKRLLDGSEGEAEPSGDDASAALKQEVEDPEDPEDSLFSERAPGQSSAAIDPETVEVITPPTSEPKDSPRQRILDPYISQLAHLISSVTSVLSASLPSPTPLHISPSHLDTLDRITRHCYVRAMGAVEPHDLQQRAPTVAETRKDSRKRWAPRAKQNRSAWEIKMEATRSGSRRAYEGILQLRSIQYIQATDEQERRQIAARVLTSLDLTFARLRFLYHSKATVVSSIRQAMRSYAQAVFFKHINEPTRQLLLIWMRFTYLNTRPREDSPGVPITDLHIPRLTGELGLFGGLADGRDSTIWMSACKAINKADGLPSNHLQHDELGADLDKTEQQRYGAFFRAMALKGMSFSSIVLSANLNACLAANDVKGFSDLWDHVVHMIRQGGKPQGSSSSALGMSHSKDPELTRTRYVCSSLDALHVSATSPPITSKALPVKWMVERMLEAAGTPYHSRVWQCLLRLYARGLMLNPQPTSLSAADRAAQISGQIGAAWKQCKDSGTQRHIGLYHEFMGLVARQRDLDKLVNVWEELSADEGSQAQFEADAKAAGKAKPLYPPISAFNHFIDVLLTFGSYQAESTAYSIFDYLQDPKNPYNPDLYTINIFLRHYSSSHAENMPVIRQLLIKAARLGIKSDIVTYTTLISGLLDADRRKAASDVLIAMENARVKPNVYLYTKLVWDLARRGSRDDLRAAERMMEEMVAVGIAPNLHTWTALIGGYFRSGFDDDAFDAIDRMKDKGFHPNRQTFHMIIRACMGMSRTAAADTIKPESGFAVLSEMRRAGLRPDDDTWYLLMSGFVNERMWDQAERVLQEMEKDGFVVHERTSLARVVPMVTGRRRYKR